MDEICTMAFSQQTPVSLDARHNVMAIRSNMHHRDSTIVKARFAAIDRMITIGTVDNKVTNCAMEPVQRL